MPSKVKVFSSRPACALGGRVVTTSQLAAKAGGWTAQEAEERTGVKARHWSSEGEDVVSLAVSASQKLLRNLNGNCPKITAVLCSVTTPREASPTVSCQVATALRDTGRLAEDYWAFDFNAACSGYLYGMRLARDILQADPSGQILLLTAETTTGILNPQDPATIFLFGDAATATLVALSAPSSRSLAVESIVCSAAPDPGPSIHVPCHGSATHLRMDGIAVARAAYKSMANAVRQSVRQAGLNVADLAALIPHPGSQRILQNVAGALELDRSMVFTTLSDTGNTSSSSIPLALDRHWDALPQDRPIGLAAFGAGFTAAAAVAYLRRDQP